jgi:hypothetical protein
MDRAAGKLFTWLGLSFAFLVIGLGLGCWLFLVEFGAAFNETSGDRMHRLLAGSALVVLNPFGSIGWFLGVGNVVPPAVGFPAFILGSAISAALYAIWTERALSRRRKRRRGGESVSRD